MSYAKVRVEAEKGKESIMPQRVPFMKAALAERENIKSENLDEQNAGICQCALTMQSSGYLASLVYSAAAPLMTALCNKAQSPTDSK